MKKLLILASLLLIFFISLQVYAHPGRTDASGGHHDYNNVSELGSYHYHCNGNPPHLHENGVCPYSYNKLPEENNHSSSSSNSSNYDSNTNNEPTLDLSNEQSEKSEPENVCSFLMTYIWLLPFFVCIFIFGKNAVLEHKERQKIAKRSAQENTHILKK